MFEFMLWLLWQIVSTAWFFVWYGKKHPAEAKEMLAKLKRFIVRKPS